MSNKILYYNPKLKYLSRNLRNNSTLAEVILWNHLKGKKMKNYKFLRQKPIENYIVDFFCPELMLAIEIDGSSHGYNEAKEMKRQRDLENIGIRFIRLNDSFVKRNLNEALETISCWIDNNNQKAPLECN